MKTELQIKARLAAFYKLSSEHSQAANTSESVKEHNRHMLLSNTYLTKAAVLEWVLTNETSTDTPSN